MIRLCTYIVIIFTAFFIIGCVDENIMPNSGNVTVHLYDYKGFPGYIEDTYVSIGPYPLQIPDGFGNVYFKTSVFPYNLRILPYYSSSFYKVLLVYDGIMHTENFLVPLDGSVSLEKYFNISVSYPTIPHGKKGFLKFISNELFSDWGGNKKFVDTLLNSYNYGINVPSGTSYISGKFLFFEVTTYPYYETNITSFDKYGEKAVKLETNNNPGINFTEDDIKFDPDDTYLNYDIFLPPDSKQSSTTIFLSFDNLHPSSDIKIFSHYYTSYYANVPASLPSHFRLRLYNEVWLAGDSVSAVQEKWIFGDPGTTITMDNSEHLELFLPENAQYNICDSSIFSYGSFKAGGVYYLKFLFTYYNEQTFITSKNKVTLGDLKNNGFIFLPNTTYHWWVEQPNGFSSVDDYLSAPYIQNPNYNAKLASEVRTFTTSQ